MTKKKKYLLFLIIAVVAVLVIGTGTVTYAWFLSLYSTEYEFQLDSDEENRVILVYDSELSFASGGISSAGNKLIPATAKKSDSGTALGTKTVGDNVVPLEPLDVFDIDVADPAHTGLMESAAHAVHFDATGAYWVGYSSTAGALTFSLSAYVKENGVADTTYDLVADGELSYFVLFTYLEQKVLCYDGIYYVPTLSDPDLTLPNLFGDVDLCSWRYLTSSDTISYGEVADFALTTDGTQLLIAPNSEFSYDLYVFVAKTEELMSDPDLNGKTLQLRATISVPPLVTE